VRRNAKQSAEGRAGIAQRHGWRKCRQRKTRFAAPTLRATAREIRLARRAHQELIAERARCEKAVGAVMVTASPQRGTFYRPSARLRWAGAVVERNKGPLRNEEMVAMFASSCQRASPQEAPIRSPTWPRGATFTVGRAQALRGHSGKHWRSRPIDTKCPRGRGRRSRFGRRPRRGIRKRGTCQIPYARHVPRLAAQGLRRIELGSIST